jgi:FkbM family methyltransferase
MLQSLKKLAGFLPERWQQSAKRFYFAWQIRRGLFRSDEPEYHFLDGILSPGAWVIDVGANVGHYTLKMSELVKSDGRVFAIEPVPFTFELLAANCALGRYKNVTLLNVAASSSAGVVRMEVPEWEGAGRLNYYEARIAPESTATNYADVFTLTIDALDLPQTVNLIKIDAEGHELAVVEGMAGLLKRDYPVLVVEGKRANSFLESLGYTAEHRPGSPNYVWNHNKR